MEESSVSKICITCLTDKPLTGYLYTKRKSGKIYYFKSCRECTRKIEQQRNRRTYQRHRRDPEKIYHSVYKDAKVRDKKKGRICDLTKEFVKEKIKEPCFYCGESLGRRALDRIDNSLGHLMSNVNTCCSTCNYIRKDMPYNVWMLVVPTLKWAKQNGLFGGWTCGAQQIIVFGEDLLLKDRLN